MLYRDRHTGAKWKCLLHVQTVLTDTPLMSSMDSGGWAKEVHSGVDRKEAKTLPQPFSREVGTRAEADRVMGGREDR